MLLIPLNLFALPSFLGVIFLDAWLLSACVWIVMRRFSLRSNCDQFMRVLVESPVHRVRSIVERRFRIDVPKFVVWIAFLIGLLVVRQVLVGIITVSCQFTGIR